MRGQPLPELLARRAVRHVLQGGEGGIEQSEQIVKGCIVARMGRRREEHHVAVLTFSEPFQEFEALVAAAAARTDPDEVSAGCRPSKYLRRGRWRSSGHQTPWECHPSSLMGGEGRTDAVNGRSGRPRGLPQTRTRRAAEPRR